MKAAGLDEMLLKYGRQENLTTNCSDTVMLYTIRINRQMDKEIYPPFPLER